MLCTAFGLMLASRSQTAAVERLRILIADAFAPILELMVQPVATVTGMLDAVGGMADVYAENQRLHEENARLLQWHEAALAVQQENESLRQLLNLPTQSGARFVTARIIGDNGGAFVRTVLVSSGARDGLRKNQAAVTGEGLAGRVIEVGERVVTSGFGGLFPPGIPVGTIARVGPDEIRVMPLVAWDRMEYLRLVDYEAADLSGLLPEGVAGGPR